MIGAEASVTLSAADRGEVSDDPQEAGANTISFSYVSRAREMASVKRRPSRAEHAAD